MEPPPQERETYYYNSSAPNASKDVVDGSSNALLSSGQVKQFNLGLLFLIVVVPPLFFFLLLSFICAKITRWTHQNAIASTTSFCFWQCCWWCSRDDDGEAEAFVLFFSDPARFGLPACLPAWPVRPELSNKFSMMWTFVCLLR